jgi:hypothetical protein
MPTVSNTETQAKLLQWILEANARKQNLEEDIRRVDAVSKVLIYNGALRDIELYKNLPLVPKASH